jgi:kynurenine formamidase
VPQALYRRDDPPVFDFSVEVVQGCLHQSTHIDAPAHIASRGRHFGGVEVTDAYDDFGWKQNGIEGTPPIVGRGILLDVPRVKGVAKLDDLYEITVDDVQACLAGHAVQLRRGDTVLVRTGKQLDYHGDGSLYFHGQPGVGRDAGIWLYERGMAVLGTDTTATEPFPFPDVGRTTHVALLTERGVNLIEILNLEELAADRVHEFLFVCLPLKIRGATGSWVRPVAIV